MSKPFWNKKGETNESNLVSPLVINIFFVQSNPKPTRRPHVNLLRFYYAQLREWFENMTSLEMENFKKKNFGNTGSLLKVKSISG